MDLNVATKNQACTRHLACGVRIFLAHLKALARSCYFRFLKLIGSSKFNPLTSFIHSCRSSMLLLVTLISSPLICALTLIFESLIALVIFFEFSPSSVSFSFSVAFKWARKTLTPQAMCLAHAYFFVATFKSISRCFVFHFVIKFAKLPLDFAFKI